MRRPAVSLILLLAALAGACSSDSKAPAAASSASSAPVSSTTTSAPATSTTTTTGPPATVLPSQPADDPVAATRALIAAWRAGDRDAAAAVATTAAVDALFVAEPGSVQDRGCNQPPPETPVLCVYRTDAGEVQLRASPVPGGWIVDQAVLSDSG